MPCTSIRAFGLEYSFETINLSIGFENCSRGNVVCIVGSLCRPQKNSVFHSLQAKEHTLVPNSHRFFFGLFIRIMICFLLPSPPCRPHPPFLHLETTKKQIQLIWIITNLYVSIKSRKQTPHHHHHQKRKLCWPKTKVNRFDVAYRFPESDLQIIEMWSTVQCIDGKSGRQKRSNEMLANESKQNTKTCPKTQWTRLILTCMTSNIAALCHINKHTAQNKLIRHQTQATTTCSIGN